MHNKSLQAHFNGQIFKHIHINLSHILSKLLQTMRNLLFALETQFSTDISKIGSNLCHEAHWTWLILISHPKLIITRTSVKRTRARPSLSEDTNGNFIKINQNAQSFHYLWPMVWDFHIKTGNFSLHKKKQIVPFTYTLKQRNILPLSKMVVLT